MATYQKPSDEGSPSKCRKTDEVQEQATTAIHGQESIHVQLVQGGFELITVEQSVGQDGHLQPLRDSTHQLQRWVLQEMGANPDAHPLPVPSK